MSTDPDEAPTPALDALSGTEHAVVLAELLASHVDLRPKAERIARDLLTTGTVEDVADEVAWALEDIPFEDLAGRTGRVPGRGYVHVTEAAWELVYEAVELFLVDMRRRVNLGLTDAAGAVAAGIVAGLHRVRAPTNGSVVGEAGPDAVAELADSVAEEAARLGVPIPADVSKRYWPGWEGLT